MVSGYTTQKNSEKNTIDASEQYVGQQKQTWDRLYSQLCANKCEQQKKKEKKERGKTKTRRKLGGKSTVRNKTKTNKPTTCTHRDTHRARESERRVEDDQTKANKSCGVRNAPCDLNKT